jgi:hypothetical protein
MRLRHLSALLLPIALACAGGPGPGGAPPPPAPPADVGDASKLLAGGIAVVPAPFKGITPGMSREEALAKMPSLATQAWFRDPAWGDLMFSVDIDDETNRVDRVYVNLPATTAEQTVTQAWGPPVKVKGQYTAFEKVLWWNPAAGLRANLGNALVDNRPLQFTAYTPTEKLVGTDGPAFSFGKAPVLGQTADQVGATFGDTLIGTWRENGKSQDVPWTKMATRYAPDDDHRYYLELPPTEYGDYWTRVHLSFSDKGLIERVRFSLPFEGSTAAKDQILATLERKFGGKGVTREEYGKQVTRFSEDPVVDVSLDAVSDAWEVEIEAVKGGNHPRSGGRGTIRGGPRGGGRPSGGVKRPAN